MDRTPPRVPTISGGSSSSAAGATPRALDRSFQTNAPAKPARSDGGTASGASVRLGQRPERLELDLEEVFVDLPLVDRHALLHADADDLLPFHAQLLGQLLGGQVVRHAAPFRWTKHEKTRRRRALRRVGVLLRFVVTTGIRRPALPKHSSSGSISPAHDGGKTSARIRGAVGRAAPDPRALLRRRGGGRAPARPRARAGRRRRELDAGRARPGARKAGSRAGAARSRALGSAARRAGPGAVRGRRGGRDGPRGRETRARRRALDGGRRGAAP